MDNTKSAKLVRGLLHFGYVEVTTASKRYRLFERANEAGTYMFVGNSGALRCGKTATKSMSLTNNKRYQMIMQAGSVV